MFVGDFKTDFENTLGSVEHFISSKKTKFLFTANENYGNFN